MLSVAEVEQLLAISRKTLAIPSRNAYEAENLYLANVERLKEARGKLSHFSGDYVERLLREVDELERESNAALLAKRCPVDVLLEMDFNVDEAEDDVDEMAVVERELEMKRGAKKKQGGAGGGRKAKAKAKKTLATVEGAEKTDTPALTHEPDKSLPESGTEEAVADIAEEEVVEVAKYAGCNSDEIPQEIIGPGRCVRIPNTPLVRLDFATPVDHGEFLCQCRVTLHRAVVTALTYGTSMTTETTEVTSAKNSASDAGVGEEDCLGDTVLYDQRQDAEVGEGEGEGKEEEEEEEETVTVESDEESVTAELSRKLIAEYDAILVEKEEEESGAKLLPFDIPPSLCGSLRSFTFLPWVILMCHGGYFAGGVFVDGKAVVHKAFQHYVVRKKQGGKQSSNEKEGGSYGSIGSQIRRAQEIKWKMNVRDILLSWRNYIYTAAVVLYVAPGPQNRAVLTDFSGLPALTTEHGKQVVSPVSLKDPRVRKAPLTTHRPTFQEVQRIYGAVSTCTVEYVRIV